MGAGVGRRVGDVGNLRRSAADESGPTPGGGSDASCYSSAYCRRGGCRYGQGGPTAVRVVHAVAIAARRGDGGVGNGQGRGFADHCEFNCDFSVTC